MMGREVGPSAEAKRGETGEASKSLCRVRLLSSHLCAKNNNEPTVGGSCLPAFAAVEDAFRNNFELKLELGAQLCIYHKGQCVVDLWGKCGEPPYEGPIENEIGRELTETLSDYGPDSLQQVFSSTKNLTAIAVAMCVDR